MLEVSMINGLEECTVLVSIRSHKEGGIRTGSSSVPDIEEDGNYYPRSNGRQ